MWETADTPLADQGRYVIKVVNNQSIDYVDRYVFHCGLAEELKYLLPENDIAKLVCDWRADFFSQREVC